MAQTAATIAGLPLVAPDRPRQRPRPLEAFRRFRLLSANKEDTEQVFHIIAALSGDQMRIRLKRNLDHPVARAHAEKRAPLAPYFDDHDALERLPEGSLGRAYCAFMKREGLSAAGLRMEARKFHPKTYDDVLQWFIDWNRDLHDVVHVLTGYGRGALGELCNLAWTYGQNRGGLGILFIAVMGTLRMKRMFPEQPLFRVLYEAWSNGRKAPDFVTQDIEALFAMPLDEARRHLRIPKPVRYRSASRAIIAMTEQASPPYDAVANS